MAAQASIQAYDGAATPVQHTFVPFGVKSVGDEEVAIWREQNGALPFIAQGVVTTKKKRLASGVYRVQLRVEIPVMESVSGQNAAGYTASPKVAYVDTVDVIGYFHERSTIVNHRIPRMLAINIANNITASVAAAGAGVGPDLIDLLTTAS